MSRIAFYGGSFNPPTLAHEAIVDDLINSGFFQRVVVKPCGIRPDKPELLCGLEDRREEVRQKLDRKAQHYQLIVDQMHCPMRPTVLEWTELEKAFPEDTVYLVTGTDLFVDEGQGQCQIHRWVEGSKLFENAYFYIYPRPVQGELILPPHYHLRKEFRPMNISSSMLRALRQSCQ